MPEKNINFGTVKTHKRRWPKIVGISLGGVIIFLAIVILLLPTIISSKIVKGNIENILKTNLNREVQIDDISMGWLSGFGIKNLSIKERDGLPGDTFVKVNRILCDIEFLPLIKKQIKIRNLIVDSPVIVFQRDEEGVFNYEDMGKPVEVIPQSETAEEHVPVVVEKPVEKMEYSPLFLPLLFDIELNASIINGEFVFVDHRLSEETIIRDLDTRLRIESLDKPIEFMCTFNIEAKEETDQTDISLNVLLAKDGKVNPLDVRGTLSVKTGFARMAADFDMARFRGEGGTGLDFLLNLDLKEFTKKLGGILGLPEGMQMEGVINSKVTAKGQLDKMIEVDGNTEVVELNISGGPLEHKPIREPKIRLLQNADIDMVDDKVTIHRISIESSSADMGLAGMVTDFRNARNLDLRFFLNCDITKLMSEIGGLLPEDTEVAGKMQSKIKIQGQENSIEIEGKTDLKDLLVKSGSLGPISEPEIQIVHNTGFNLQDNSLTIKKFSIYTSFAEIVSSGDLNGNKEIDLDVFLAASDINKLMHNLQGIVLFPQGLIVSGKVAGEVNAQGNIEKEIKLSGKTILYGINATGGPLKNARISNLDLKFIHTLDYDKAKDYVNIEQMDIVSEFLDMSSKGKIANLNNEKNIDYELSLNTDLDDLAVVFAEMLPANMSMGGKGMVGLGLKGKLSAKDNLYEGVNLNGNVSIDTVEYDSYKVTDLKSKLRLDDGLFTTKDFVFKLNEGRGKMSAKANLKDEKPALDFSLNLSDVRIDQKMDILAYAIPILSASNGQMSGILNMAITAQGKGLNWQDDLSKSLNAVGEINIKNGYIKGDKIISRILKKEEYKFDDITTPFRIDDEKVFADAIKVNSEDFDIGLSGWTSFDGQIEYTVDAEVLGKYIGGDVGKILGELGKGSKLPIVITGTIDNPKVAFKRPKPQDVDSFLQGIIGGLRVLE
ncbi:MAG: AsmA family protein [Candidatus Scalinduaceae bacterium]